MGVTDVQILKRQRDVLLKAANKFTISAVNANKDFLNLKEVVDSLRKEIKEAEKNQW